jgi:hypothetical protein
MNSPPNLFGLARLTRFGEFHSRYHQRLPFRAMSYAAAVLAALATSPLRSSSLREISRSTAANSADWSDADRTMAVSPSRQKLRFPMTSGQRTIVRITHCLKRWQIEALPLEMAAKKRFALHQAPQERSVVGSIRSSSRVGSPDTAPSIRLPAHPPTAAL